MNKYLFIQKWGALLPLISILLSCSHSKTPVTEAIVYKQAINGVTYSDPYKHLENRKDPKTLSYIRSENEYAAHYFERISKLKNRLVKEFEEQEKYKKNLLARETQKFHSNQFLASPDNLKHITVYPSNNNQCRLVVNSFDKKTNIDSIIGDISGATWSGDSKSIVYVKNKREVLVHRIATPVKEDQSVYKENRDGLTVDVNLSKSSKYIIITSKNNTSSKCFYFPTDLKNLKPKLIEPLKEGHLYFADHFGSDFFIILSDLESPNRKLFKTPVSNPTGKNWITVLEGNDSIYIDSYTILDQTYLVLMEKKNLNASLRLFDLSHGGKDNKITFKEPDGKMEFLYYLRDEHKIVFSFASLLTPVTIYSYNLDSRKLNVVRRPSVKDYKKEDYIVDMIRAISEDGSKIPVSIIHKNGMKRSDGKNPLILLVNGSYGNTSSFYFTPEMISLLDRGIFIACAHVRGGGEFGKPWWEGGKLLKKKNSIADYLACAGCLIQQGFTSNGMITALGNGASGVIIGAAVNQRPEFFKSALFINPFVDLTGELIDTANIKNLNDIEEFGNPFIGEQFQYMLGYSPYDNVKKQQYPAILFKTCLPDQNRDPSGALKMVARLRANKTDNNILLMKTNENKTVSVSKEDLQSDAENWAFILEQYGIEE